MWTGGNNPRGPFAAPRLTAGDSIVAKFLLILLLLGGAAGAGWWWWQQKQAKPAGAAADSTTVKVAKGSIFQAIASTGRVVSNLDVDIKCKASGIVTSVPFDISDAVKAGELLVELDPVDENRAVQLADVALSQSQAKLKQARQNLLIAEQNLTTERARVANLLTSSARKAKDAREKADRRKKLVEQQLSSAEEYSTAETEAIQAAIDEEQAKVQAEQLNAQDLGLEVKRQDIKLAEAEVQADQVALSNSKQRLADTKVMSPMDGVVSARNVQKGTIISSGITNVGGGTTTVVLSDLSRMFVLAAVDESEMGRVAIDQPVTATVDAHPGRKFKGRVVRIATKGVNVSNVVTFEVKIEILDERKNLLKPEMTANVQIVAAQADDVLVVPAQAVTRKGRKTFVNVLKTAATETAALVQEEREVKVGLGDGEFWEVKEGLAEGEEIVIKKEEPQSKWRADQNRMPMGPGMGPFPGGGRPSGGGGGRGRG